jgi:hypothetical protein
VTTDKERRRFDNSKRNEDFSDYLTKVLKILIIIFKSK